MIQLAHLPRGLLLAPLALVCAVSPPPALPVQLAVCVPAIAIFGLPHGATDWRRACLLWRPRHAQLWVLRFAAFYGSLMLLVAAAAAVAPAATLAAFIAVAIWHFGTEDAGAIGLGADSFAILACGIPPVLGPALFWPAFYTRVVAMLGVTVEGPGLVRHIGAAACLIAAISLVLTCQRQPRVRARLLIEQVALLALLAAAPPLPCFTAYFCLLHGPRHMASLPRPLRGWQIWPVTALAVAIIATAALIAARYHAAALQTALPWAATNGLLWGLAALTLPHVALGCLAARAETALTGLPSRQFANDVRTMRHG